MGLNRLGIVIKGYIAKVSGSGLMSQWVSIMEWAGDQRKAQVFGGVNEDSSPAKNTQTVDIPIGRDRGFLASIAYRNPQIPPVATQGEKRIYSTNADGDTLMAEVYMKADGTIEINGNTDNLVTWLNLNLAMEILKLNYNTHVHAGGQPPDNQIEIDIESAKSPTLKTIRPPIIP